MGHNSGGHGGILLVIELGRDIMHYTLLWHAILLDSFNHYSMTVWNEIPIEIRNAATIKSFKYIIIQEVHVSVEYDMIVIDMLCFQNITIYY